MAHMRKKLDIALPENEYAGGFSIWARLPSDFSANDWLVYARTKGVPFDNAKPYFVSAESSSYARFCFSLLSLNEIEKAVEILATTMQEARATQNTLGRNRRFLPFS